MHEDELRAQLDRALGELTLGGHARHHATHLRGTRHLQPVRPVVVERGRVEQLVQRADQIVDVRHPLSSRFLWRIGGKAYLRPCSPVRTARRMRVGTRPDMDENGSIVGG